SKGLRSAEQQNTEQRHFAWAQLEMVEQFGAELGDPRACGSYHHGQILLSPPLKAVLDGLDIVGGDRIAVGGLIARCNQAVQRERIIFRRDPLLFQKASQESRFNRS